MISDFYDQSIVLLEFSSSTGGYWSTSTGSEWTTDVSIDAAVNLLNSNERFVADGYRVRAEYVAYCDPTTEVYAQRRCRWNGDTFEIVDEPQNVLQKDHHYRFLMKRVQDA
jgi:hypothetical protein